MPASRFKKLFPKLSLTSGKTPKTMEKRVMKIESDIRDLRSIIRELIETLEWELFRDLDRDARIGHVSSRRRMPKTARLTPYSPPRNAARLLDRKPAPLPPNIP